MLLVTLFALFVSIVFASNSIRTDCTNELEGIVFGSNGPYKEYLTRISAELKPLAFFYETSQADQLVQSFVVKYGVFVQVTDAMGNQFYYSPTSTTSTPTTSPVSGRTEFSNYNARAVMNLGAYSNNSDSYTFSFLSFNGQTGTMYEVTVGLLKSAPAPVVAPAPVG